MTNNPAPRPAPLKRDDLGADLWAGHVTFRHGQCDPAGIVYTPKFFDIFNQMIEAWFCEALGIDYYQVIGPRRTGLGYAQAACDFFIPCKMGDRVEIVIRVAHVGTKSYRLILHAFLNDAEALRGTFTSVTTSLDSHAAIAIPEDIRAALIDYQKPGVGAK